ncbi:MAG: transposase [Synechococcaceae cyanobacterium]
MRHLNGVVTQAFNGRHRKLGFLFQCRFKSILVDRDAYLLEVCYYVEVNPVRARMVTGRGEWPWSSIAQPWARLKPSASPGKFLTASGLFCYPPTFTYGLCAHNGSAMNITISADEKISESARKAARGMGKSLNQAVRDDLEQIAAGEEGLDAALEALRSMAGRGNSGGQRIRRDELSADRLEYQRGASHHRHQHSRLCR